MEKFKDLFFKVLPCFIMFAIGLIVGELLIKRHIDGDCEHLKKFRNGAIVYYCDKYVPK